MTGQALAAANDTTLISRATGVDGAKANGMTIGAAALSADGRFVAFESSATNLDPADTDTTRDIFLRDTLTNVTSLISRADGAGGVKANGASLVTSISADGRFVGFLSEATNIDPADVDNTQNVYLRDTQTHDTVLIDRADGVAGAKANGTSFSSAVSADGRFVAFDSDATNLGPPDTGSDTDVYVRDTQTNDTSLISRADGAAGAQATGASTVGITPAISADGRFIAFLSGATNLDPADPATRPDIYLRDTQTNDTSLISRADGADGAVGNQHSFSFPDISPDGRFVVFSSGASNFDPADTAQNTDIYLRDTQTNETSLISRADGIDGAAGLGGMSGSQLPTISADGRFVSYQSDAPNLDPDDTDGSFDVYLRDTQAHVTTLISRADGAAGSKSNSDSFNGGISADGKFIGFMSGGSNLDPDDTDTFRDVYLRETGAGDSPGGDPPGGDPGPDVPDTRAPVFDLSGKKQLKVKRTPKKLKVKTSTDEACTAAATGTIKVSGVKKKLKLKPTGAALVPGTSKLKLKLSGKTKRLVTKALAAGKKSKAKIRATCTDAAGNLASDKQKVKVKRKPA